MELTKIPKCQSKCTWRFQCASRKGKNLENNYEKSPRDIRENTKLGIILTKLCKHLIYVDVHHFKDVSSQQKSLHSQILEIQLDHAVIFFGKERANTKNDKCEREH